MNRRIMLGALPLAAAPGASFAQAQGGQAQAPAAAPSRLRGALLPEGAIADGASHPLSQRFPTIAAARAVFPHAGAMTDEIDWCALQGAINRVDAQGGGAVHVPNGGRGYVLNRGLLINPTKVTMRGDGTQLDFRTLPRGGRAVWFKAEGGPHYGHDKHVFEGFELVGPGRREEGRTGVHFQTDIEVLSSRMQMRDCVVREFHVGLGFGNRAYLISFAHCSFYECHFVFHAPAGLHDAGENISFSQCTLFNSYCLIANMAGFGLRFIACSLDYGDRIVWDNNGQIDFMGCHIEISPPSEPPFHNGTGRIDFQGGFFQINGSRAPRVPGLFAFNVATEVHMVGLRGWNWRTTTGRLVSGPGKIIWYGGTPIDAARPARTGPETVSEGTAASARVAVASVWLVGGRLLARGFDVASLLVLGRLLGPGEFGMVATAMTLIYVIEAICELPVSQALTRAPDLRPSLLDTAFTLSLIRGVFIAIAIAALSFPFADFAQDGTLIPLICVLGFAPAIRGMVSPRMVVFVRNIDFRRDFLIDILSRAGTFCVALIVAFETRSYWALAAGTITAPIVAVLLSYAMAPYRPRLSLADWRDFLHFLGWNTVAQIFIAISWQIDRFVLGRYAQRADFGRFAVANDLAAMPYQTLVYPLVRPLLAGFSTLRDDLPRLRSAYRKCCQATALVGTPILVGIALLADPIIRVALGAEWRDAGPLLACLALSGIAPLLTIPFASLAMMLGRTKYLAISGFVILWIKLIVVLGAFWFYGVYGVAIGRIVFEILGSVSTMILVRHLVGIGLLQQIRAGAKPVFCAAVMAACLLPIVHELPDAKVDGAFLLGMAGVAALGGTIYSACVLLVWHCSGRPAGMEDIVVSWLMRVPAFRWLRARSGEATPPGAAP